MNFNSESKQTQLASAMFAKDTAGEHDTAKYSITRSEIRVLNIPGGSGSLNQEVVIHGRLPQRIVIGLTGNFNGAYYKKAF